MGGTMKNYRAGGIEAADKEGIMEVGADVKIIQGHNSRASLGETEGVRGKGAMIRGTKFVGVL
jgi:hypothetical protein